MYKMNGQKGHINIEAWWRMCSNTTKKIALALVAYTNDEEIQRCLKELD